LLETVDEIEQGRGGQECTGTGRLLTERAADSRDQQKEEWEEGGKQERKESGPTSSRHQQEDKEEEVDTKLMIRIPILNPKS
jgi:hypothetical protein